MTKLSIIDHLKVLFLFSVLAIVLTYPRILNMNNVDGLDDYMFVFSFWWFKKAIFSFQNPFFTDFMFFPEGTSLAFHATTFSNFVLTLPFSMLFGVNVAVNVAYLLTMVISGYTAFLLSYELTGSKYASVIAGLVFAFNPFHIAHGRGHLHISTLQWIPLFFLFFKWAIEHINKKWAVFAGIAMGIIILTDQMQTICTSIIIALAVPLLFFQKNEKGWSLNKYSKQTAIILLIILGVASLTSSVYLYQAIMELITHPASTRVDPMGHGGANMFSGDLLGYFTPPSHPILGRLIASRGAGESHPFFGYLPLILTFIGVFKFRRIGIVKYIAIVTFLFWILSMGTYLHINGAWKWDGTSYALPFLYLTDLPIIGDIRTPCRFHMITILGVSLLAAYGVKWFLDKRRETGFSWLTLIFSAVVLFEFLPSSPSVDRTPVPELYKEMAKDKESYTVLELPLARWSVYRNGSGCPAILMYYQTIHGKRIFNGYISRATMEALAFKDPILDFFVNITTKDNFRIGRGEGEPTESQFSEIRRMAKLYSNTREEFLRRYNIKYIVLHNPISRNTLSEAFVEAFTGKSVIDVPQDGIAYVRVQ